MLIISKKRFVLRLKMISVFFATLVFSLPALSNPVLDHVAAGNVQIQQSANVTQVRQTSGRAIINWQSFNIHANEATHFQQPVGGIALNRISPQQGASQIYGTLTATGKIILVNQAGIYFGPGARVDVGGLIATTSGMSNKNFLSGQYRFDQASSFSGSIINEGTIVAAKHGLIALAGTSVSNQGLIQADMGRVVLASGKKFTVNLNGDQLVNFVVNEAATTRGVDHEGNVVTDAVRNSGVIIANGGKVLLTAKNASQILDHAINMSGVIEAKSVQQQNGEIILSGNENGVVAVSGILDASGKNVGEKGGKVKITGQYVLLDEGTLIDASGRQGGGNINIGGGLKGTYLTGLNAKSILPNAIATVVAPHAVLKADAIERGNGGNIIVWSDGVTKAYGSLSATGGALTGNGGFIETSGHYLDVAQISVNTSAPLGHTGMWLLDPYDITISNSATTNGSFNASNPNVFTPSGSGSNVDVADLLTNLATSDVTINTSGGGGSELGNITISDGFIFPGSNQTLTLNADNSIILDPGVRINVMNNTFILNALGGDITIPDSASIEGNNAGIGGNLGTLELNAAHTVTLLGDIGQDATGSQFNPLSVFTINAENTVVDSTSYFAAFTHTYNTPLTGTLDTGFRIYGLAGDITFNGALNGGTGNLFSMLQGVINNITVNGDIGTVTPADLIDFSSGFISGNIILGASQIITNNAQTYNYPVIINGPVSLTSNSDEIVFNNTVTGGSGTPGLSATAASNVNFTVSTPTGLDSLNLTGANIILPGDVTTTGAQAYDGLVTLAGNTNFSGTNLAFTGGVSNTGFDLNLNASGDITLDGTFDVNALVAQGASAGTLTLPNVSNTIHLTDGGQGTFGSVASFSGFNILQGQSGTDSVVFDVTSTITSAHTAIVNGVAMTFNNITLPYTPRRFLRHPHPIRMLLYR